MLKKIVVEKDSFLFSKTRILDGQRMQVAAGVLSLTDSVLLDLLSPSTFMIMSTHTEVMNPASDSAWIMFISWRGSNRSEKLEKNVSLAKAQR